MRKLTIYMTRLVCNVRCLVNSNLDIVRKVYFIYIYLRKESTFQHCFLLKKICWLLCHNYYSEFVTCEMPIL